MTQVLTNQRRTMLIFILRHKEYCERAKTCACAKARRGRPPVPSALTLPALATIEAPDAVLSVKEVRDAIRRGDVTAKTKAEAKPVAPSSTTASVPQAHPAVTPEGAAHSPKKRAKE
jgi:hypothetical protein